MSTPPPRGLERKSSASTSSIHCYHLSPSSTPSRELTNYSLCAITCVYILYWTVSGPEGHWSKYSQNCGNTCDPHVFPASTYVWLHQPRSSRARKESQNARSTTNINISNLLCCATANRTDTTQRALINHDYEAPLAAASLGSHSTNSILSLSVGTPCTMIQVVK